MLLNILTKRRTSKMNKLKLFKLIILTVLTITIQCNILRNYVTASSYHPVLAEEIQSRHGKPVQV